MLATIISGVVAVAVAVIEAIAAKDRKDVKKWNEENDRKYQQRVEESRLSMKLIYSTLLLSETCSNALTNGHNNGNVEKARTEAQKAREEYENFIMKISASELAK